jgi:RNA polymerase-binding transcription factor DksA
MKLAAEQYAMDDKKVKRFRDKLLEMRQRLQGEIEYIDQARVQLVRRPGDLSDAPLHNADSDAEGLDVDLAVDATLRDELRQINDALERITKGTYGKCQRCEKSIAEERLEAIPYAPYCIECVREMEEEARQGRIG